MDRVTAVFVDGMGAAAATSGVLTQLQGRIFGLLYLQESPRSLDEITDELQQSKSNVSLQIRGLLDWHLVRHVRVPGSRRDHYEAATDFFRVMQEIVERRFRWNMRQVLASTTETEALLTGGVGAARARFVRERVGALRAYFATVDAMLAALSQGAMTTPPAMREATSTMDPARKPRRSGRS